MAEKGEETDETDDSKPVIASCHEQQSGELSTDHVAVEVPLTQALGSDDRSETTPRPSTTGSACSCTFAVHHVHVMPFSHALPNSYICILILYCSGSEAQGHSNRYIPLL